MHLDRPFPALLLVCLPALVIASSSGAQSTAAPKTIGQRAELPSLFVALERSAESLAASDLTEIRRRAVAVRSELLDDVARGAAGCSRMRLELFDGESAVLAFAASEDAWGSGTIWRGRLEGAPGGSATFSRVGAALVATVRRGRELYRLIPDASGLHALVELDESRFPACATGESQAIASASQAPSPLPPSVPRPPGTGAAGSLPAVVQNDPAVDVLVVYTPLARSSQGGTAAMQALVNLALAESNQAYQQSQVGQRLRLVHQAELAGYVENGDFGTELSRLTSTGDGFLDNVHALRDQFAADEVSMIIDSTQYCGIAWLMTNIGQGFQSNAFNVVSRSCTSGYYSFAHELGHNMACHHDHDNAGSAAFPYAYGYRTPSGNWRTIMAYAPGTRIQYFSNPNVSYGGEALGIPEGLPLAADNAKVLNATAATSSQWRCAIPAPYGTSKTMSTGTLPALGWTGTASLAGGNLALRVTNALPGKVAIAFYGFAQGNSPFLGGTLYVSGAKKRLGLRTFDAAGSASWPFPTATLVAGDTLYCQAWFRDAAHPDGTGIGLTHGLRLDFCP